MGFIFVLINALLKPVYPFMYVKLVALFSNTTFLCVTIIMFLSSFHAILNFFGMITYMLMIVNTAVYKKTWNSHVEKLLSTKKGIKHKQRNKWN